jgi:hypothetical protein
VGECQTPFLYGGPNLTSHTPQAPGRASVIIESIVRDLEGARDFALSLRDAGAAVEAILGMAAVQGLPADRLEVMEAVAATLRQLEYL